MSLQLLKMLPKVQLFHLRPLGSKSDRVSAITAIRVQDIDDILRNRTEKRQLGNSKGNTFSTATFTIEEEPQVFFTCEVTLLRNVLAVCTLFALCICAVPAGFIAHVVCALAH